MPQKQNTVFLLRLEVITRLARLFWEGKLVDEIDKIPYLMRPRDFQELSRCCLYKDRAILRERLLALMGFRLEEHPDDSIPLKEFAKEAIKTHSPNWPFLTVCDVACHSCAKTRYFVSDACQSCVARTCVSACHFGAITITGGRSHIDPATCRNCGMCHDNCPYQAIVHLSVPCEAACPVQAMHKGTDGRAEIDFDKCTSCGRCMRACPFGAVMERSEVLDVLLALTSKAHVTALVAPAIVGQFKGGLADHSEATTALHTATHLLHAALRKTLGTHVGQKGSNITAERLRFDFTHPEPMTKEQIQIVEDLVNDAIRRDLPVTCETMTLDEARNSGAIAFFDSKYGEMVKVYTIGDVSKEVCGGPHVTHTGDMGHFRILKEQSSSAGVRRIKAVLEK